MGLKPLYPDQRSMASRSPARCERQSSANSSPVVAAKPRPPSQENPLGVRSKDTAAVGQTEVLIKAQRPENRWLFATHEVRSIQAIGDRSPGMMLEPGCATRRRRRQSAPLQGRKRAPAPVLASTPPCHTGWRVTCRVVASNGQQELSVSGKWSRAAGPGPSIPSRGAARIAEK